jgi:hypothetical protein
MSRDFRPSRPMRYFMLQLRQSFALGRQPLAGPQKTSPSAQQTEPETLSSPHSAPTWQHRFVVAVWQVACPNGQAPCVHVPFTQSNPSGQHADPHACPAGQHDPGVPTQTSPRLQHCPLHTCAPSPVGQHCPVAVFVHVLNSSQQL